MQPAAEGTLAQLAALLDIGGPVVSILMLMSLAAVTIVIVKLLQFARLRINRMQPAEAAFVTYRSGDAQQALRDLRGLSNPAAVALAMAISGRQAGSEETRVREEVVRYGNHVLYHLRQGLRPLEVIGTLAPLLGLLGTVLGMIEAFQQLEAAGNQVNPAVLSGGIWEALLTTAVGLVVAIPVVAFLNWLERRVDHLAHTMNNLVTGVFTEALQAHNRTEADTRPNSSDQDDADTRLQPA
ncbi:MAG: MotA/TolQ/ExbB proton channel family protein [Pseudomonadota bacterium]